MRLTATGFWLLFVLPVQAQLHPTGPERIVFRTVAGDLVFALYPDVAPESCKQFLKLARHGIFDGTHFVRIEPGFVLQLANADDRLMPMSPEQSALIHPLKAEFSSLRHSRGHLSLARFDDDIHSAATSFSILLSEAPHLDGKYTIFGEMEPYCWPVVDELVKVPTRDTVPVTRLTVVKVDVYPTPELLGEQIIAGARPVPGSQERAAISPLGKGGPIVEVAPILACCIASMVILGLVYIYFGKYLTPAQLRSVILIGVLVGGFALLITLVPYGHDNPWLAVLLFFGVIGLFKLMSQFEVSG